MRVFRTMVLVTALVLAFAAPAAAMEVPIKGTVLGGGGPDYTAPGCPGTPIWRFNGSGTGQMSHLGRVTYEFTHCTYPDLTAKDGIFTLVAVNGDELVLGYEAAFALVGPPDGPTGFTGEGIWTAVGGTGRFTSATGSGTWGVKGDIPGGDALFGLPDGYMRFAFKGAIAYEASDRSAR